MHRLSILLLAADCCYRTSACPAASAPPCRSAAADSDLARPPPAATSRSDFKKGFHFSAAPSPVAEEVSRHRSGLCGAVMAAVRAAKAGQLWAEGTAPSCV
uniref:Secreted protein n=1 Tax=Macrostomum lignano TaxID=282301 RepID=A0A1I8FP29_9PLAT